MRAMTRMAGVVAAAVMALTPIHAAALTLPEALRTAYRNSDVLEQNRALLRAQDETVGLQLARLRPILDFFTRTNWDSVREQTSSSIGLTLSLLAYDNGVSQFLASAAEQQIHATRARLVSIEQQVLLDAITAYIQVWRDDQVVAVRQSNVRVLTQQLRAAEDRFEVGEDTRTDVALAQSELATARSNLALAQGQLEISRELFELAIGEEYEDDVAGLPALPDFPDSEDRALGIARQMFPLIQALQFDVAAAEFNLASAQADFGPDIRLQAERTWDPHELFEEEGVTTLTLSMTQPIYSGGRLPALERQAIAELGAARAELNRQVLVVAQALGQAYANFRVATAQIVASEERIRAATLAFQGVREEAALGARTTLDVLDAEQDLLDARIARIEAEASQQIAAYTILQAMGLLTVEHLSLGIETYDPTINFEAVRTAPPSTPQGERLDRILERYSRF